MYVHESFSTIKLSELVTSELRTVLVSGGSPVSLQSRLYWLSAVARLRLGCCKNIWDLIVKKYFNSVEGSNLDNLRGRLDV